jgi:hypothetical protein
MATCRCTAFDCPVEKHTALVCDQPATHTLRSRDFGDELLPFCPACAIDARRSGMFVEANP